MVDLEQFRGKRALVCGVPSRRAKTWGVWDSAVSRFMDQVGTVHATFYRPYTDHGVRRAISITKPHFVVLLLSSTTTVVAVMDGVKGSGIPVLRVRRDGSVEVDEP